MKMISLCLVILVFSVHASAKKGSPEKKSAPTGKTEVRKPQTVLTEEEEYAESVKATSNCLVTVTTVRASGVSDVQQFYSQAPSKEECERRAKPHRPNLYPEQIKSKTVTVKFME